MPLADEIDYATSPPRSAAAHKYVLIFFIPGNPGLVEYYRQFLDIVRKRLDARSSSQDTQFHLHGASLAGFDVSGSRKTPSASQDLPLSLDAQVEDVYNRLDMTVSRLRSEHDIKDDLSIVVVGHSIGAYMVLQTVAQWQKMSRQGPTYMKLSAGICLFPTIYELATSPTGRQVGVSPVARFRIWMRLTLESFAAFDQNPSLCSERPYNCQDTVLSRASCNRRIACAAHHPHASQWRHHHRTISAKRIRRLASIAHGQR